MKKESIGGLIAYLIIFAIAVAFGATVLRNYGSSARSGLSQGMYILLIIGAILIGIIFNATLFELAHLLGAKAGHYNVVYVNILGLCFSKKEGKINCKFSAFDGLTGETKIFPKQEAKPSNPTPYLMFGTLFFAVEVIICVSVFIVFGNSTTPSLSNLAYCLLTILVVGGMIWVYNFLPFQLDTVNDGYRLTMISNPKNKEAFNELLRVEHEISEGNTNVEIKTFTEITNFTADLNLNKVYVLLDKREFLEAEKLLDDILDASKNISLKTFIRAKSQKIFINLMTKDLDEAKKYYDECVPASDRREISADVSMPSIRAYILMSGLLDKSRSECLIALKNLNSAYKSTPAKRKTIEAELFNEALEIVDKTHPDWELGQYKIKTK